MDDSSPEERHVAGLVLLIAAIAVVAFSTLSYIGREPDGPRGRSRPKPQPTDQISPMTKRPTIGQTAATANNGSAGIVCDRFEASASLSADWLTVSLETDLPGFALVLMSVSRSYWAGSPPEEYPLDYFTDRGPSASWSRPRRVNVSHTHWAKALDERKRKLAILGAPERASVVRVDDALTVSFTLPVNQPNPAFGRGNERLTGSRVSEHARPRVIESTVRVAYPLDGRRTKEYGDPLGLREGLRYRLERQTPLAPERHPADPIGAMESLREMPGRSVIAVMRVDRSDADNPWYEVRAYGPDGESLGFGWVNSYALLSQTIEVVEP